MDDSARYEDERQHMVDSQLKARGIRDALVLDAMRSVPRHCFVPSEYDHLAYADGPLPIGHGQTISQPYIVALMTELLELEGHEKVLEIGTGSGYQAAVLAHIAHEVYTIERHAELAKRAAQTLAELGLDNVHIHVGDGSLGWPEHAPYQAIIVTAAAPSIPAPLLEQLDDRGRLVAPVGDRYGQLLERWRRRGAHYDRDTIAPVAFVPLRGQFGWEDDKWDYQ